MPAVSSASLEAHSAKGNTRETCLRSFFSTHASSSKSLTSPAIWTSIAEESKREIRRTPLRPSRMASANVGVPTPFGLTTPIPVITQRLFIEALASLHESSCSGRPSSALLPSLKHIRNTTQCGRCGERQHVKSWSSRQGVRYGGCGNPCQGPRPAGFRASRSFDSENIPAHRGTISIVGVLDYSYKKISLEEGRVCADLVNPQFLCQRLPLPVNQCLSLSVHQDLVRPRPRESLAGPLTRRIHTHL